jgi:type I restriction enzyme S subunit
LHAIEAGKNLRCEERCPREGERGVVKVSAVTWGHFDDTQSKTLPSDYMPPEKARIRQGDLLISRANTIELVGAVALVESEPHALFLSDKILRLVVDKEDKRWIMWFLRSSEGRQQIENSATGNQLSMRNISQEALRQIRLPFPDSTVRHARVQQLEAAFARANRLEAEAVVPVHCSTGSKQRFSPRPFEASWCRKTRTTNRPAFYLGELEPNAKRSRRRRGDGERF